MAYYKRTRVVSQDMRTGEFAYLDQLVKDGYNPGLLVLPKNWEPPVRLGPSRYLPIEPIFNLSPPNTTDTYPVIIQNLVDINTGLAVLTLFSNGQTGVVTSSSVEHNVTGIECVISLSEDMENVGQYVAGVSSDVLMGISIDSVVQATTTNTETISSCGTVIYTTNPNITGQQSIGSVGTSITNISQPVTGQSSVISLGTVLNGSGWSQGGGWGRNGWGS